MGTLRVCFKYLKSNGSVNKIDLLCFPVVFFVVSRCLKPSPNSLKTLQNGFKHRETAENTMTGKQGRSVLFTEH